MGTSKAGLATGPAVFRSLMLMAALPGAGCFTPAAPADCTVSCTSDRTCPAGLTCTPEGVCAGAAELCAAGADGDAGAEPSVLGDVLTYTFDGPLVDRSVWDRSGNFHGGHFRSAAPSAVPGAWGQAIAVGSEQGPGIEASVELGALQALTFEAWVVWSGSGRGVLFGDRQSDQLSYELSIEDDGALLFSIGCGGGDRKARSTFRVPRSTVEASIWVHVAVTWDGRNARLYLHHEQELSEEVVELEGGACDGGSGSPYLRLGSTRAAGAQFEGLLDEVKLSSRAKTAEELSASRDYDSTALVAMCGDGYVEGDEECERSACCDPSSCRLLDGVPCASGGTCERGVCVGARAAPLPAPLVDYAFAGSGTTIVDEGLAGLDLTFEETSGVSWSPDGRSLVVEEDARIASGPVSSNPTFMPALAATDALTIEALVRPASASQIGPARIVTVSEDNASRDVLLAQDGTALLARLTTSRSTDGNGVPSLIATDVFRDGSERLLHLAYTRDRDGEERLYVDGVLRAHSERPGTLEWPTNGASPLRLAHEGGTASRFWHGDFARIRIFDQALSELQVSAIAAAQEAP